MISRYGAFSGTATLAAHWRSTGVPVLTRVMGRLSALFTASACIESECEEQKDLKGNESLPADVPLAHRPLGPSQLYVACHVRTHLNKFVATHRDKD